MQFLLGVTHSTRAVDLARNSLNFLRARYRSTSRLENLPHFSDLTASELFQPYLGQATFWLIDTEALGHAHLVARIDPGYKVQHGIYWKGRFVTGGDAVIEIRDREGRNVASASDPWLSGLHTVFPTPEGRLAAACSGSDAVLIFDPGGGEAVRRLRMPEEIYGKNYPLGPTDDTRAHYIHNDLQLTHLNCAFPCDDGIYVSTLIQGALGLFALDGSYREILRGFIGCHGVRRTGPGVLLFADSCAGAACFVDIAARQVRERIDFDSRWLHDAEMLGGTICAGAVSDRNVVSLYGLETDSWLGDLPLDEFGASVMFLHSAALEPSEAAWFLKRSLGKVALRPASSRTAALHPNVAAFLDEKERAIESLADGIRERDGLLADLQAKAQNLQSAFVETDRALREEIQKRERALDDLQSLANGLQARLIENDASLREEIRRRDGGLRDLQILADGLQKRLVENDGSLREEIRRRDAALDDVQKTANRLQARLVESDASLREEIRRRDTAIDGLQRLANGLQARLVEEDRVLRAELAARDEALKAEVDRRERLLARAREELDALRAALEESSAQAGGVKEILARREEELRRMGEQRDGALADVERLREEVGRLIEQIEFLKPKTFPQKAASRLLWPRGRTPARRRERG